jgi:hypothetical protein
VTAASRVQMLQMLRGVADGWALVPSQGEMKRGQGTQRNLVLLPRSAASSDWPKKKSRGFFLEAVGGWIRHGGIPCPEKCSERGDGRSWAIPSLVGWWWWSK